MKKHEQHSDVLATALEKLTQSVDILGAHIGMATWKTKVQMLEVKISMHLFTLIQVMCINLNMLGVLSHGTASLLYTSTN